MSCGIDLFKHGEPEKIIFQKAASRVHNEGRTLITAQDLMNVLYSDIPAVPEKDDSSSLPIKISHDVGELLQKSETIVPDFGDELIEAVLMLFSQEARNTAKKHLTEEIFNNKYQNYLKLYLGKQNFENLVHLRENVGSSQD